MVIYIDDIPVMIGVDDFYLFVMSQFRMLVVSSSTAKQEKINNKSDLVSLLVSLQLVYLLNYTLLILT